MPIYFHNYRNSTAFTAFAVPKKPAGISFSICKSFHQFDALVPATHTTKLNKSSHKNNTTLENCANYLDVNRNRKPGATIAPHCAQNKPSAMFSDPLSQHLHPQRTVAPCDQMKYCYTIYVLWHFIATLMKMGGWEGIPRIVGINQQLGVAVKHK